MDTCICFEIRVSPHVSAKLCSTVRGCTVYADTHGTADYLNRPLLAERHSSESTREQ